MTGYATLFAAFAPQVCMVTGLRARYRDPETGSYFHDLGALRKLKNAQGRSL